MDESFSWRDGERLIRFGEGTAAGAPELIAQAGLHGYTLLTTERALGSAPFLEADAERVVHVPAGKVDELSAALLEEGVDERPLVALGGGRVVDTAKALAGALDQRCAALPTTLSGAEMTPFHRLPKGRAGARMVRPALVVADPALPASQPPMALAASALNALGHAVEALYTPLANPVAELAALRAAELIAGGVPQDPPDGQALALAAVLAGYASGTTGIAVHHAVCQTIVRSAGTPHAETNAVMLPYTLRLMALRAPGEIGALAQALGDSTGDPDAAAGRASKLSGRSGHTRLSSLGVAEAQLPQIAAVARGHPAYANTPQPPGEEELLRLLGEAL